MCTAVVYKNRFFGRNLDVEKSYGEAVAVMPRKAPIKTKHRGILKEHYAITGTAFVSDGVPLWFDAINEKGLGMAGLRFGCAGYAEAAAKTRGIASYEMISCTLARCASAAEAKEFLRGAAVTNDAFSPSLPPQPLHWFVADGKEAFAAESEGGELRLYDDPIGVLAKDPPFLFHERNLSLYMGVGADTAANRFSGKLSLRPVGAGTGSLGLPGDMTSPSRFVRAAFVLHNSVSGDSAEEGVSQFFHILGSVSQPKGCSKTPSGEWEYTALSTCGDLETGVYSYKTYENSTVRSVDMHGYDLDKSELAVVPIRGI